jgi:hypothetical protein
MHTSIPTARWFARVRRRADPRKHRNARFGAESLDVRFTQGVTVRELEDSVARSMLLRSTGTSSVRIVNAPMSSSVVPAAFGNPTAVVRVASALGI